MINLFKRIYLNYDIDLRAGKTQQRIIVTNRKFPHSITSDPQLRAKMGILSYYKSVDKFIDDCGGLLQVIDKLYTLDDKVCLITTPEFAALLQACVFKSLVKTPTPDAAYLLYRTMHSHQYSSTLHTLTNFDDSGSSRAPFPAVMTPEAYRAIYDQAFYCDYLKDIVAREVPIEYLMANYFSLEEHKDVATHFLMKYRNIALENAVFRIRTLRNMILTNTVAVSKYLGKEVDAADAMDELVKHPATAWLADDTLSLYSDTDACKKYSLDQLNAIYTSIEQLLGIWIEERPILTYLAKGDVAGLVDLDLQDGLGNFIGTEHHATKINGVFVNKCYQEVRNDKEGAKAFFQQYVLRDLITHPNE